MRKLVIEGVPIATPRMTRADRWRQRPCVLRYWRWRDAVKAGLADTNLEGVQTVLLTFYLPIPKSWSAQKRLAHYGQHMHKKPDLDNLVKGALDSLWPDGDEGISSLCAQKYYEDEQGPRMEVDW